MKAVDPAGVDVTARALFGGLGMHRRAHIGAIHEAAGSAGRDRRGGRMGSPPRR